MINEGINIPEKFDYHLAIGGLGNRIAPVLRGMLDGKPVAWVDGDMRSQYSWSDFFENDPPCEIVHVESRKAAVENMDLAGGSWAFPLEDISRVAGEINNWRPSERVSEIMLDIPAGTIGYKLRLLALAKDREDFDLFRFDIPDGCFLACDSADVKNKNRDSCIVNIEGGMTHDYDRGGDHWLFAVADWFMLMQCEHVVEVFFSTFPTAHKISGLTFNTVNSLEQWEQVLSCGSDIYKMRAIESCFEDRIETFTWAQEYWGSAQDIDQKLNSLVRYLGW